MAFSIRIYTKVNIILILTVSIARFGNLQLLKREVRYTKFDIIGPNSSILTVLESGIKHYHEKQMLHSHYIIHENLNSTFANVEVLKCKDYYVDCVNVVSYEISNICEEKTDIPWFFSSMYGNNHVSKGCHAGEFQYDNITLSADHFGTFFSFPMEKWWELYWKFRINLYTKEKIQFFHMNLEFYFIQYRSRNRLPRQ